MKYTNLTEATLRALRKTTINESKSSYLGDISFVKKGGGYYRDIKLNSADVKSIENVFKKQFKTKFTTVEIIVDPKEKMYKFRGVSVAVDNVDMNFLVKLIGQSAKLDSTVKFDIDFGLIDNEFWFETSLDKAYDLTKFKNIIKRKLMQVNKDLKHLIYSTSMNDLFQ